MLLGYVARQTMREAARDGKRQANHLTVSEESALAREIARVYHISPAKARRVPAFENAKRRIEGGEDLLSQRDRVLIRGKGQPSNWLSDLGKLI
jgi:hypothetical protein